MKVEFKEMVMYVNDLSFTSNQLWKDVISRGEPL